ncbi:WEB family protein At5g16730, chloroplastic-like [Malania oleifera]|uniref:WEB family protein At5g16730, chloroplastic-like n=1 Tax=Malania oleifera TaxID=397392 RepID=UPI0025ADAAFE|nr:WEB family protein At5g16730, chloroplastic-like [Malania oleifera]
MSSKSKSGLSETPNSKASPATPRVSKLGRGITKSEPDSHSPLQHSRPSIERSPRSVNSHSSKPAVDRRSPKLATPPEKQISRVVKGSELQAQLNLAQEDLKKAKEQLVLVEKEKAQAVQELNEAQKLAEEANEKLREALVAQKRAEEDSEIEKFRALEMEQAGIEAAQKKEEEWLKELEAVRSQHALDVSALLSATHELQKLKQELAMTSDAKNRALSHADDATKIAEIHAEKVEFLSAELAHLKTLLDSKLEAEASENKKIVLELNSEIDSLKRELEKSKGFEEKLVEREASIEQLNVELEAARMAESYARNLVEEWKQRVEELENQVKEANRLERSASESLNSVMKQLEGNNDSLHEAEAEIASLREKVGLLEISLGRQKGDIEESEHRLDVAKEEALEMGKMVESLESQLEAVKEEKALALSNEKLAASSVQSLLEEKNKLINELENSRDEEEKSKKAMESLASALHEVSLEAREAKEKLISNQAEHENYETQLGDMKLVLKATNEKYETVLDNSKHEIDLLTDTIEQSKHEFLSSKAEWEQRELHLVNCVNQSQEENSSKEKEMYRLVNLLKEAEAEAHAAKEERAQLKDTLKETESQVIFLKEVIGESKAESMKIKEGLLDKENELQSVMQENEDLRTREAASLKKVEELSKLLEEAMAKKQSEENGELTDSEKDYDMLPKVVEFSEENGHGKEEKLKTELPCQQSEEPKIENPLVENNLVNEEMVEKDPAKFGKMNGKPEEDESKQKEDDDSVEVDFKMWETCKIGEKDFSPEREQEQESFEEELDSKVDGGESFDQINGLSSSENVDNGGNSPSKQQQQKKKKTMLRKFGSLLKKKGSSNQK